MPLYKSSTVPDVICSPSIEPSLNSCIKLVDFVVRIRVVIWSGFSFQPIFSRPPKSLSLEQPQKLKIILVKSCLLYTSRRRITCLWFSGSCSISSCIRRISSFSSNSFSGEESVVNRTVSNVSSLSLRLALGERRKSRQRFLTNVMENASGFWISPSSSLLFHNLQ